MDDVCFKFEKYNFTYLCVCFVNTIHFIYDLNLINDLLYDKSNTFFPDNLIVSSYLLPSVYVRMKLCPYNKNAPNEKGCRFQRYGPGELIDKIVLDWFNHVKNKNVPVFGPVV